MKAPTAAFLFSSPNSDFLPFDASIKLSNILLLNNDDDMLLAVTRFVSAVAQDIRIIANTEDSEVCSHLFRSFCFWPTIQMETDLIFSFG